MAKELTQKSIKNLGVYGNIREASVDSSLIPEGALLEAQNVHFDRIGAVTVRPGLTGLGSTIISRPPMPAYGFHNALSNTAVVVFNEGGSSAIYTYDGSLWNVNITGGTASVNIRFLDFGSCTIALNFSYNTYASLRYIGGNSGFMETSSYWKVAGTPINGDQFYGRACTLGEVYKSRVYLSGDTSKEGNPSRLYFSSVITTAGNITWDRSTDFVDINPGDGESITGLKRFSLELLIFKPNYIYRFRTSGVDPDPLIKIGTRSQESIVEGQKGMYFHHDSGFYRYSGGYPALISKPVQDIVDAIPFSQYGSIISWTDNDHVYFSIGNVTVAETKESLVIKNCVLRYTESSDVWTVYAYSNEIRRAITYTRGTTLSRLVATDHGVIATQNSGFTDLGNPIKYKLKTKWYDWGSMGDSKIIQELFAVCEKAQASQLFYQIDEDTRWIAVGELKELVNYFKNVSIRFKRIRFMWSGITRIDASIFKGIEITKGLNEGIIA